MKRKALLIGSGVGLLVIAILVLATAPELVGLGGDPAKLRRISSSFIEDVQFKDFTRAARYHESKLRKTVDIPYLLERLFHVKPELLDIMDHEIVFTKIDSTGLRGRVKLRVKVKSLANGKIYIRELMLYYYREAASKPWYMRLESSLRLLHGKPDKIK